MKDNLFTKAEIISLKTYSELNEKWLQDKIANDTTILSSIREWVISINVSYLKHYIGLTEDGCANNFSTFNPHRKHLTLHIIIDRN